MADVQYGKQRHLGTINGVPAGGGGKMRLVESGVEPRASLTNGAFFAFAATVNPATHSLRVEMHDNDQAYARGGHIVMKADGTGFYYYCRNCPGHDQALKWSLKNLTGLLQDNIEHFRETLSIAAGGWNTDTFTAETLKDYANAEVVINHVGRMVDAGADYLSGVYGEMTAASTCTISGYSFGSGFGDPVAGMILPMWS